MTALICILFYCNTSDHSEHGFIVFIDPENMGVDTIFVAWSGISTEP